VRKAASTRTGAPESSLERRLDVLLALTRSDLRARYGRGPWQLLKWLVDPFALLGVYLVLVTVLVDRPGGAIGLSIACAIVPFQLVMMTVTNGLSAVALRGSIILNMNFDRMLIPVAATLTETVAFGASIVLLVLMMVVYGVAPTPAVFAFPLVVAVTVFFALGCAYGASLFTLWLRDLRPFAISFVRTLFFLAPGLVALSAIEEPANTLVRLNPLTGLFESYRAVLLYGEAPAPWMLLIPFAAGALLLLVFMPLYQREQQHFAKVLE
jgi:lipopolysaccharide transport system permease protein